MFLTFYFLLQLLQRLRQRGKGEVEEHVVKVEHLHQAEAEAGVRGQLGGQSVAGRRAGGRVPPTEEAVTDFLLLDGSGDDLRPKPVNQDGGHTPVRQQGEELRED